MGALLPFVVTCAMCNMAANIAISWVNNNESREYIVDKIVALCVTFNIQRKAVCRGVAEAHVDVLIYIIKSRKEQGDPVVPSEMCGLALYPDCTLPEKRYEWSLDLDFLGPKPPIVEPKPPPEGSSALMVLQLTDFHLNPDYEAGSNAECGEPTCCRSGQDKPPASEAAKAGHWGDYRDCDAPHRAITDLLANAKKNFPDTAYVMFTGDVIDHVMWETSVDKNRESFNKVMSEIRDTFPDVPLLPVLGNHEAHPLNVFTFDRGNTPVPENISTSWLYTEAAESWGAWLPADQKPTIIKGGYYSYEVRPGLLVIALNNNFCYNYNWWLMYDNFDPADQLRWLALTLHKAEAANQKVHILAHVPMNSGGCISSWRREYQRIIHRFENTVVAQFHGHDHIDTFNIYYDPANPDRATNVAFTGGSATAYQDVNPNYRAYTVEGDHESSSYRVLNYETWFFNLTDANLAGEDVPPHWQKLYSFKEAYGLESMLPSQLDRLVIRMANNTDLQDEYYRRSIAYADRAVEKGCDYKCKRALICNIVSSDNINKTKCNYLLGPSGDIFIKDASNDLETLLAEAGLDDNDQVGDYDVRKDKATDLTSQLHTGKELIMEKMVEVSENILEGPKGEELSTEVQDITEVTEEISSEIEMQPGTEDFSTEMSTEDIMTELSTLSEEISTELVSYATMSPEVSMPETLIPEEITSEMETSSEENITEENINSSPEESNISDISTESIPEEVTLEETSESSSVESVVTDDIVNTETSDSVLEITEEIITEAITEETSPDLSTEETSPDLSTEETTLYIENTSEIILEETPPVEPEETPPVEPEEIPPVEPEETPPEEPKEEANTEVTNEPDIQIDSESTTEEISSESTESLTAESETSEENKTEYNSTTGSEDSIPTEAK